jgi:hypothetical protein
VSSRLIVGCGLQILEQALSLLDQTGAIEHTESRPTVLLPIQRSSLAQTAFRDPTHALLCHAYQGRTRHAALAEKRSTAGQVREGGRFVCWTNSATTLALRLKRVGDHPDAEFYDPPECEVLAAVRRVEPRP